MHTGNRCPKNNKSQSVWSKEEIQLYWFCRRRTEFWYCIRTLCTNSFRWKDLMKAHHLIFPQKKGKACACCVVSRHGVSVGQNYSSKPKKARGVRNTLKCGIWEEKSTNFGCCSAHRVWCVHTKQNVHIGEPTVTNGSDDSGDLSLRDACFGKPRVCAKVLAPQAMFIPGAKAAVDKEWKDV